MSVSIKDIARAAGLSTATVSLALNGSSKINAHTRQRIERIAREMGYQPNPFARQLVTRRSRQIGLIVPDLENVYYASLAQTLFQHLSASGYGLSISTSMNMPLAERRAVGDLMANRMEAILLAPVHVPNPGTAYLERLKEAQIPLLFVTSRYPEVDSPCVMCDLYTGMKDLCGVLYRTGRRRIALLTGAEQVYGMDLRTRGYQDFCREMGLEYQSIVHLNQVGYAEAQQHIRSLSKIDADAFVCVNDMMALGVVNALRERGISIPDMVAVGGYDDVIFSEVSPVPITTVRQDISAIAAAAANAVLNLVQDHRQEGDQILPCRVIIRNSAG